MDRQEAVTTWYRYHGFFVRFCIGHETCIGHEIGFKLSLFKNEFVAVSVRGVKKFINMFPTIVLFYRHLFRCSQSF